MKSSGFKKPDRAPRTRQALVPLSPEVTASLLRQVDREPARAEPIPKDRPLRDEGYRRWIASLPCAHCGKAGPSQCAHADSGGTGGMGLKESDETCFPLCADSPGRQGCHHLIGSTGAFSREQRRVLEAIYAGRILDLAREAGKLPKKEK